MQLPGKKLFDFNFFYSVFNNHGRNLGKVNHGLFSKEIRCLAVSHR